MDEFTQLQHDLHRPLDLMTLIRRRKTAFVAVFGVGIVCTVASLFLATPLYRGEVRMMIGGEKTDLEKAGAGYSIDNFSVFENYLKTQIEFIGSQAVAGKVYRQNRLAEDPRYRGRSLKNFWMGRNFKDDLVVKRISGSRIISLAVFHPNPQRASELANQLARVYVQENLNRRAMEYITSQRIAALNSQLALIQSEFDRQEVAGTRSAQNASKIEFYEEQIRSLEQQLAGRSAGAGSDTASDEAMKSLLDRIRKSLVQSSSRISNVEIIDSAGVPSSPDKPNKVVWLLTGLAISLMGACFVVLVLEHVDNKIRSEDDIQWGFHPPIIILGQIFQSKLLQGPSFSPIRMVESDNPENHQYGILRSRILWSLPREVASHSIVFCSSIPGEGKTTVSSSMAVSLAGLGKKVLLIDADLRRGRQHDVFNLRNDAGMANYLEGLCDLQVAIQKSSVPGLDVMTSGRASLSSSGLFHSHRMDELVTQSEKEYDFVLYDTPPLSVVLDASIIIQKVRNAIHLIRCRHTPMPIFRKSYRMLKDSPAQMLGVILNGCREQQANYDKYYRAYSSKAPR